MLVFFSQRKFCGLDASKYQTIIENAQNADEIIRKKYMDNKAGIDLLSLPEPQLKQAIPSANPVSSLKDHAVRWGDFFEIAFLVVYFLLY